MFSQLLQPFSYLKISHADKRAVDWFVPSILTIPSVVFILWLQPKVNIFGNQGLIQTLTQFVQTLPGFYIAALAAIVTFSSERMDEQMPAPAPTIIEMSRGKKNQIPLTRRRFLSMMFAFLTAESFLVVILGLALTTLAPAIKELIPSQFQFASGSLAFFVYLFAVAQMAVATFWGLYYLGTRIHAAID